MILLMVLQMQSCFQLLWNTTHHAQEPSTKDIAIAMGVEGVENMSQEEYRKAAVDAVKKLSADVGIPADLKAIVKAEDVDFLAQSAMDDACRPGNPKDPTFEDIKNLYLSLM